MSRLYGVSFKKNGKIYYYKYPKEDLNLNTKVIVIEDELEKIGNIEKIILESASHDDFNSILKKANISDIKQDQMNRKDAQEALIYAKRLAIKEKLNMHLLSAEYDLNRKKLQFNFTAEERIDFRNLAKKLANKYKLRIELHQIGIRDKAKATGGMGQCGRSLCCKSFLGEIGSISINTVKKQNLAINPAKINGQCGRLLCCLMYEEGNYAVDNKNILTKNEKLAEVKVSEKENEPNSVK